MGYPSNGGKTENLVDNSDIKVERKLMNIYYGYRKYQ